MLVYWTMPSRVSLARSLARGRFAHFVAPPALGLAVFAAGCAGDAAKKVQAQAPPGIPVKIEVARSVPVDDSTEYVATLKSRDSSVIMPQVEGPITQIFVRSGDRVSLGSPILEIDPAKQEAAVKSQLDTRSAKLASLEYAKQQYERVSRLQAEGVTSRQDLDQAKSALDAAQAELQSLDAQVHEQQVQLQYYRVAAPRGGIIGDIPVRVGDRVTVSTILTTLDEPGSLEAYVSVPVERSPQLRLGMPLQIVDSTGKVLADSRVRFLSPEVDNQTQTVLVKTIIDNNTGALRTAQFVRARVIWETHPRPVIPVLAVSRNSGRYFAFVAEGKDGSLVARQKPLRIGEIVGNDYVVIEGIKPGDRVIVSGTQLLLDGAPISPQS
ncbi:MAG TPA: efflux RND transporter periplasmic adaptor subunit [Vicinamibacteria bacterium]|nr:efflux RND transporter periplasmic adaptor subunit [Vicinamibacteria bacterium]